jgi:hypothetical protein
MTVPSPKLRLKTDNHSLKDKCNLRRLLIQEAQMEPLRVLDLYAGEGHIWTELRRQSRDPDAPPPLQVEVYTPVDSIAKQSGQLRFKISPRLIASLNGDPDLNTFSGDGLSRYNIVDVDCYGDPFEIWHELLFRIKIPTVIFLTRGRVTYGAGRMPISNHAKKVLGIPESWNIPGRIELLTYADKCQLLQPCATAKIEIGYQLDFPRVSYYAVFVRPQGAA